MQDSWLIRIIINNFYRGSSRHIEWFSGRSTLRLNNKYKYFKFFFLLISCPTALILLAEEEAQTILEVRNSFFEDMRKRNF